MFGGCKHAKSRNLHKKNTNKTKKNHGVGGCRLTTGEIVTPLGGGVKISLFTYRAFMLLATDANHVA